MSNWLSKLFSGGVGDVVRGVKDVVDEFHTSDEEKHEMAVKIEAVITQRMQVMQESVQARYQMVAQLIQAEMASGDNYTKRARPTIVYFGLAVIFINYLLVPMIQQVSGATEIAAYPLPVEFWAAWGGVCGLWTIGRSAEKKGATDRLTRAVTGSPSVAELLEELKGS